MVFCTMARNDQFHLERWTDREWSDFSRNFSNIITALLGRQVRVDTQPAVVIFASPQCHHAGDHRLPSVAGAGRDGRKRTTATTSSSHAKPPFRSFAAADRRLGLFTHRDLAYGWNDRRTRVGSERHRVSYLQSTVLREFGHTLGPVTSTDGKQ